MTDKQTAALKLALEVLEYPGPSWIESRQPAITAIREALAEQPAQQQEPVAVKQMMLWVDSLKRLSDNGQHMKIPSGLSAGTCWELAIELEQFLISPPASKPWVGLEQQDMPDGEDAMYDDPRFIAGMVWANNKLREKNNVF